MRDARYAVKTAKLGVFILFGCPKRDFPRKCASRDEIVFIRSSCPKRDFPVNSGDPRCPNNPPLPSTRFLSRKQPSRDRRGGVIRISSDAF